MTSKATSLMLGLGLLAASAGLAAAADWNNGAGGINVYRSGAAVPVPAPAPIPVHPADWYMRGDLNFALFSNGQTYQSGPAEIELKAPDDMPRYFGATIAVGRYFTPSIRADLSIDYRSKQRFASGATTVNRDVTSTSGTTTFVSHWTDTYNNEASIGHYAGMINGYYDFKNSSPITPYIGAGIGVAMHMMSRTASDAHVCNSTDVYLANGTTQNVVGACTTTVGSSSSSGNATAYGFAANIMAGLSYEVSPGILSDTGYRLMYLNGHVARTADTGLGASLFKISDRVDHEIRTGLRWNID